jgi:hypothetical protein
VRLNQDGKGSLEEAADREKTPDRLESTYRQLVAQSDLNSFDAWRASRWWGRTYYILGLPAAVLAGIAGAVGLANTAGRVPAAIIALVAAALTAAVTFLNIEINRNRNTEFCAEWCILADDTRLRLLEYYIKERPSGINVPVLTPRAIGRRLKTHSVSYISAKLTCFAER